LNSSSKILIITSEFPPGPGGIGNHSYNLAKNLSLKGVKVNVLVISDIFFLDHVLNKNKSFKIHRIVNKSIIKYFKLIFYITKYVIVNKKIKFIITGHLPIIIFGNIFGLFVKDTIGIIHGHESLMGNNLVKFLTKKSLLKINTLISVSKFSKQKVLEKIKHPKIKIISNGFDRKRFEGLVRREQLDLNKINLITVGSVSERKGQKNVIRALPTLKSSYPEIEYHMIGNIYIEDEINKLAMCLDVTDNIKCHGYLDDLHLTDIMNNATIFIMLSENLSNGEVEGFGIAILEANYFGVPVIGAKDCGIEDAVKNGYSGILIDNNDINQLKTAIDNIMNNYEVFTKRSKEWSKRFYWERVIDKYIKYIDI